jgi:hypothetical protein
MPMELEWRGCRCKGGEGGSSNVTDRECKSVLRDGRRRDAGEHCDSISAAARTALRDGVPQRRTLELPLAVHTSASSSATSLVMPSAGGAVS